MDPSSPALEQPGAPSEVESAVVAASAHKAEAPASYQQESAPAPMQVVEEGEEVEESVSAQKQSKRHIKSAPQKREHPLSALAPQYLSLNCRFQCNRG